MVLEGLGRDADAPLRDSIDGKCHAPSVFFFSPTGFANSPATTILDLRDYENGDTEAVQELDNDEASDIRSRILIVAEVKDCGCRRVCEASGREKNTLGA